MKHRIAIGADHRGYALKSLLLEFANFGPHTIQWLDVGTDSPERTDYPVYTLKVVNKIRFSEADKGIFLCGSGIGPIIAANRFREIYAGVAWNQQIARDAKQDDNINILSLPADHLTIKQVPDIIEAWLSAQFKGGRYQERLDMLDNF